MKLRLAPVGLLCAWSAACSAASSSSTHPSTDAAVSQDVATSAKDSGGTKDSAGSRDSASPKDSVASNDARSAECNALTTAGAPDVPGVFSGQPVPVASGGTIADGTYVLTADVTYPPQLPPDAGAFVLGLSAAKVLVSGSTWQLAESFGSEVTTADGGQAWTMDAGALDAGNSNYRTTLSFAASGDSFTLTQTCGSGKLVEIGTYTATPTEIVLVLPASSTPGSVAHSATYTKQ
jgi:hypothetical protein